MGKSKSKFDVLSLVIIGVMALAVVMAIVGICISWLSLSAKGINGKTTTEFTTLAKMVEANNEVDKKLYSSLDAIYAFAILSVILSALVLIIYILSKFVKVKALKFVVAALSALLVVFALLSIILTFTCYNTDLCKVTINLGGSYAPAAGAWLLAVFGVLGGASGLAGALKK